MTIYNRLFRFKSDERGSLMIFAAIGIFLLFIGVFALSIDTGISYKDQSNLEAKLTNCANYAASEYAYWKIRNIVGASDRPSDNLVLPKTDMSEEEVLGKLRGWTQDCVRAGELKELKEALVTSARIEFNSMGQEILVFDANTPQSGTFNPEARDAVINAQVGKLTPFFTGTGTNPPEVPPVNLAGVVVFPLNYNSKAKIGNNITAFTTEVKTAFEKLNMVGFNGMRFGLQTGNIPADKPQPISNWIVRDTGWSGGMLDDSPSMASGSGHGNSAIIREWPFYASIWAPNTRRCDGAAVWTYEKIAAPVPQGRCFAWTGSNGRDFGDDGTAASEWCTDCVDQMSCINCRVTRYCPVDKVEDCRVNRNGQVRCRMVCPEPEYYRAQWNTRQPAGFVYSARWSISCPKDARTTARTYQDPSKYLKFTAIMVANLDGTLVPENLQIPLVGDISKEALGAPHQANEFKPLVKNNTDNAWFWACGWKVGGSLYGGTTGAYGNPQGQQLGRDLVAGAGASLTDTPNARNLDCMLGNPPGGNGSEYKITFKRPGCGNPEQPVGQVDCNIPEGYYQIRVSVSGLKPTMRYTSLPAKAPPVNQPGPGPFGQKWAYATGNARSVFDAFMGDNDRRHYWTGAYSRPGSDFDRAGVLMCNNPNSKPGLYLEEYVWAQDENNGTAYNISIPAEYLKISDIAIETYRNSEQAGLEPLDLFDKVPDDTSSIGKGVGGEDYVMVEASNGYPFFPETGATQETPALNGDGGSGVATFNGDQNNTSERVIGIMPIGGKIKSLQATGYNKPVNSNPISNLETVKFNGENRTADNIPIAMDSFTPILDALSYNPYNIHSGHGANEGPLMNAALYRLQQVAKADDRTLLIYVGGCPPNVTYKTDDPTVRFQGKEVNWFANSNSGSQGPGTVNPTTLKLEKADNPTGNIRDMTKQIFNNMKGAVDYFMIVTNDPLGECKDFAALTTDGISPTDVLGNSSCLMGNSDNGYTVTPADCAAEVAWAIVGDRREARKGGMKQ